jgi:membrane protease subunit HflC
MSGKNGFAIAAVAGALLGLAALSSTIFVLPEGQQALIVRLGQPLRLLNTAGLKFKLPFIDTADVFDTRVLSLVPPSEQIILGDQKRIQVGTFTEYRIADPLRFDQSVHSLDQAQSQLALIIGSSLRRVLGQATLPSLLSDDRIGLIAAMRADAAANAAPLGIAIVDVQIKQVDLPEETSQAIYDRMTSERQREATELRAQGFEWAQSIKAQADQQREAILSTAQESAKVAHGEGDAAAWNMFAAAFSGDLEFFKFYRSLQTYSQALAGSAPLLVLTPDSDLLRYFKNVPDAKVAPGAAAHGG